MLTEEDLAQVPAALVQFLRLFADVFGGYHRAEKALQYVRALLTQRAERRNAENLAECEDGITARAFQWFLSTLAWPIGGLIDRLQWLLGDRLQAPDGTWIVDESGNPKQGTHSVGVARQWCGRLGKVANCQVGVFLAYASARGAALVDGRLYLPEEWLTDARRAEGQIPSKLGFATKVVYALGMLRAAVQRGALRAQWVVADETYGRTATFRQGVAALDLWYLAEIDKTTKIRQGLRLVPVATVMAQVPASQWQVVQVADGAQGPRYWELFATRVRGQGKEAHTVQWLVLRRNLDGSEPRFYFSNASADTGLLAFGQAMNQRSRVEQLFEEHKGECGLDEYEVRSWPGWYHHMVLSLLAHAFLLLQRQDLGKKGDPSSLSCRLTGSSANCCPSGG